MVRRLSHRVAAAALTLGCAAGLSSCGADDAAPGDDAAASVPTTSAGSSAGAPATSASPSIAPTKVAPPLPDCAEVWVEGRRLPKPYKGCLEPDGRISKSVKSCSMGATLAQYGTRFYGIPGRPAVLALPSRDENQAYLDLLATCTG